MSMTLERATAFKDDVEQKIEILLDQFAGGEISREHFDVVYERYSRQLGIADQAIESGRLEQLNQVMNEIPTMVLNAAVRGMALGMSIVHHHSLSTIRRFGEFHMEKEKLNQLMDGIRRNQQGEVTNFSDIEKLVGNTWVVTCTLENTSLLTLFRNEPAAKQVQELERRHRDFESANRNILNQPEPDPEALVYPVELFVKSN